MKIQTTEWEEIIAKDAWRRFFKAIVIRGISKCCHGDWSQVRVIWENSGSQATCLLCLLLLTLLLIVYYWALYCPHKILSLFSSFAWSSLPPCNCKTHSSEKLGLRSDTPCLEDFPDTYPPLKVMLHTLYLALSPFTFHFPSKYIILTFLFDLYMHQLIAYTCAIHCFWGKNLRSEI